VGHRALGDGIPVDEQGPGRGMQEDVSNSVAPRRRPLIEARQQGCARSIRGQ